MTHAEMRRAFRLVFGYLAFVLLLGMLSGLTGCNADCASPFEKPDVTTEPVQCQQAGCQS